MNKYFDDSMLGEKIIDIILPSEVIYKEDKGEPVAAQYRQGRIDELYPNRKVINTRYGNQAIIPQVKVYFRAFADDDSVITIDIYNFDDKNLFKKFIIKSKNNNYNIEDMKSKCEDIKNLLTTESENVEHDENEIIDGKVIQLIEHIRNIEDLKNNEIAQ